MHTNPPKYRPPNKPRKYTFSCFSCKFQYFQFLENSELIKTKSESECQQFTIYSDDADKITLIDII